MKIVTFEGQQYEVPDEARYMARELVGEIWWYSEMPELALPDWPKVPSWRQVGGECGEVGYVATSYTGWDSSLVKLPPTEEEVAP